MIELIFGTKKSLSRKVIGSAFMLMTITSCITISAATKNTSINFENLTIQFKTLGTADGLSHASATAIVQDADGYLWFGTQAGLNRYSGDNFVVFLHDPASNNSLSHDHVRVLFIDSSKRLWIGTQNGLNLYEQDKEIFRRFLLGTGEQYSGSIRTITEDKRGVLWVGAEDGLYRLVEDKLEKFQLLVKDSTGLITKVDDSVFSILEDSQSHIWIGTSANGLIELDANLEYLMNYDPGERGNPGEVVFTLFEDVSGQIWGGLSRKGIFIIDPKKQVVKQKITADGSHQNVTGGISDITLDRSGNLWIATLTGLYQRPSGTDHFLDHVEDAFNPASLSNNLVEEIFEDDAGVLWFSTQYGVSYWHPSNSAFWLLRNLNTDRAVVSMNNATGFALDNSGNLIIALQGQGIFKWTGKSGSNQFWRLEQDGTNLVLQIAVDAMNNIWATTMDNGLFYVDTTVGSDYTIPACRD